MLHINSIYLFLFTVYLQNHPVPKVYLYITTGKKRPVCWGGGGGLKDLERQQRKQIEEL